MSDARLNFRVPSSFKARLELFAWQRRIAVSELLRQIAEDYLSKQEEVKKEAVDKDHLEVSF